MNETTLKKLDELMTYARCQNISSQRFHNMWQTLRDEIVAERCENCRWWDVVTHERRGTREQDAKFDLVWPSYEDGSGAQLETDPDFHCSHFEKKEK